MPKVEDIWTRLFPNIRPSVRNGSICLTGDNTCDELFPWRMVAHAPFLFSAFAMGVGFDRLRPGSTGGRKKQGWRRANRGAAEFCTHRGTKRASKTRSAHRECGDEQGVTGWSVSVAGHSRS